jgi:hypothetical protein
MKYYLNFIFFLIQLLLVESDKLDSNNFYQKLLMTTNQRKLLSISMFPKTKPPVKYPRELYAQFYPKRQTSTSIIPVYNPHHFNDHYMYQLILSRNTDHLCSYGGNISKIDSVTYSSLVLIIIVYC